MILPFSTKINGKETNFVSKIWESLIPMFSEYPKGIPLFKYPKEYRDCVDKGLLSWYKQKPKRHTIREDKKNRWKVGTKIDFFINARQKNMFRFAPVLPVVSTQKIEIKYSGGEINTVNIVIDDLCFVANYSKEYNQSRQREERMLQLAQNDGFSTIEDFLAYFNKDYTGKIIHWTDKKY